MNLEETLSRLGIREKLYQVYHASIELGESPVSELAARTGLPRTTTYSLVLKLEEEGLVRLEGTGRKRTVIPRDPSVLLEYVAARRQMVMEALPHLRSLYNQAKGKPSMRFYEGAEGVQTVLWETLNARGSLRATFSMAELSDLPGIGEVNRYRDARIARKIEMKVVRSRTHDVDDIWPDSQEELRELRWAPDGMDIGMTTFIYNNCVALISSTKENYGLIIESAEYAAHQAMLFDALWGLCKPERK